MPELRADIFLCYRREERAFARLIWQALEEHFGSARVFWDANSIDWGVDYVDRIDQALNSSAAMVAIVGRNWPQLDDSGGGGIKDLSDPVRREITGALKAGLPILPTLVDGASMPLVSSLPDDLARFAQIQAFSLSDDHWDLDIGRLVKVLDPIVSGPTTASDRSTRSRSTPAGGASSAPPKSRSPEAAAASAASSQIIETRSHRAPSSPLVSPTIPANQKPPFMFSLEAPSKRQLGKQLSAEMEARRAARAQARLELPKFYERLQWWLVGAATLALCVLAGLLADPVDLWFASLFGVPGNPASLPVIAAIVGFIWAAAYISAGTGAYDQDPRRGPSTFVTRGILGGWTLLGSGSLVAGVVGAFPLTLFVGWGVSRFIAEALPFGAVPVLGVAVLALYTWFAIGRFREESSFLTPF